MGQPTKNMTVYKATCLAIGWTEAVMKVVIQVSKEPCDQLNYGPTNVILQNILSEKIPASVAMFIHWYAVHAGSLSDLSKKLTDPFRS